MDQPTIDQIGHVVLVPFIISDVFSGALMAGTILVLALLEDYAGVGSKEILGVNALSSAGTSRQSQFSSRIRRRSEAMATKLGPSFHTEPPTSYTFSNDTGITKNRISHRHVCQF